MIDTDAGNQILYNDTYPALPDGNNVLEYRYGGVPIDFTDADTYYRVSSVNYLAAGACNYSNPGTGTLWPLSQIVNDTQYYVRDAVINYIAAVTPPAINPRIEGRVAFPPVVDTPEVAYLPGNTVRAMATFMDQGDSSPYSCKVDYGDGALPLAGVVSDHTCTGPAHTYTMAGLHTITVYVTDKDGFTGWAEYEQEAFAFDGFYAPIRNTAPWYRVPAGSTVPVAFSLGGEFGMNVLMPGSPRTSACGSVSSLRASGMLTYSVWNGQYSYLWQTGSAWSGTCRRLVFNFVDGSTHTAYVRVNR
jgi:hypothetical protein